MKRLNLISITLILFMGMSLFGASCIRDNNTVYSEFADIPNSGWDPVRVIPFSPWPIDSVISPNDRFNMNLTIRHDGHLSIDTLSILITEESLDGIQEKTIQVPVRNSKGKYLGKREYALYETSVPIHRDFKLPRNFGITLTPLAARASTSGLRNVGVSLNKL